MGETNKKHELMRYSPVLTRDLYRAIAARDEQKLSTVRATIRLNNGEIGNAEFRDLEIQDSLPYCARHLLNVNREHWTANAHDMDTKHEWDADGVWLPAQVPT